ncbi:MAG: hypothetical protein ACE5GX_06040 [Thermoanaerobaculia bacterium]
MGTFHQDKSELHGITVVVETSAGDLYVGRCDDEDSKRVILLDADMHRPTDELTREDYLARAFQLGVWNRFPRLELERSMITSIRELGDLGS